MKAVEPSFKMLFIAVIYIVTAVYAAKDLVTERWIERVAMVMLVILLASQILGLFFGLGENPYKSDYAATGIGSKTVSTARALAVVFAMFMINPRKKFNTMGLILSVIAIISAFVRGPFLASIFGLVMTMSPWSTKKGRDDRSRNTFRKMFIVLLPPLLFLFYSPVGDAFLTRMEGLKVWAGGTASGRTVLWKLSIDHFFQSDLLAQIFGAGPREIPELMLNLLGNAVGSHSEWLDLLCSYGIIGAFIYMCLYLVLAKTFFQLRSHGCSTSPAALGAISMLFFLSLASGGTLSPTLAPLYCFLAFLWGNGFLRNHSFYGRQKVENRISRSQRPVKMDMQPSVIADQAV